MKRKGFSFYFGLIAMLFSIGAIIYSIVTGWTLMIGKFVIVLLIGIASFTGGLRSGGQVERDAKDTQTPPI